MAGFESQDFLSQNQMERLRISDDTAGVDDSIFNYSRKVFQTKKVRPYLTNFEYVNMLKHSTQR